MRFFSIFTSGILVLLFCAASGFANPTIPSVCDAVTGNLVANCGFEQDSFNGWTLLNNDGNTVVGNDSPFSIGPNSGLYFASLGAATAVPTTIEQTLSDILGTTLTFSFYYASDGNPHSFAAEWNGAVLYAVSSASATTPQSYQQYSFTETASGSDTIAFIEQNPLGFDALDDVVVVDPPAVPEPSSLAFAAAALAAIVLAYRTRAKTA